MQQESKPDSTSTRFVSALTKNTVALILAGGRGSRLKALTDWRAKPAVPFGGKFRIIDFPLSNCMNSGIRRIGVVTQYKAHSLIQHIQRGWGFLRGEFNEFVELLPAQQRVEEEWYKGTADAVFQNLDILRVMGPEYVLILAGDHIYKMDYGQMLAVHVRNKADMTVACINVPIEEAKSFGVMGVDENDRIIQFREKPSDPDPIPGDPTQAMASMGIYVFNAAFLYEQLIRDADDPNSTHDFGHDIIPYLIKKYRVFAHRFSDSAVNSQDDKYYWRDVGTIDAYWEANMELTKVVPDLNMYDREWPIWTYQEQLPPAKFVFDEEDRRGKAVDALVSGGCIISGSCVKRSLLFSDVRVNSYSLIEDSVILPKVDIGRYVTIKRAVIDKGCKIPDGMQIGVNPDEDRKRFYVSEKGITLVTPDMLGQSIHQAR
ncbi:glucose-1-phosphate adenylyltransferase [Novimethylophilus kurashikiensis]|uniref:Glucose-1-phosphate adenylyltransferase n=1 Tax=Novimethylophilus kurashikiensis TaxID=1825523 RepID=A0A2R5F514_9PROT|nr:glucose-1-phosphate adenylyltransferase [Novimethylophilus kurashikiensis]GBG13049.1 glucose-1-phosphate adenylyltransferase [Novimethylophilus kurashikiensis]